MKIPYDDDAFFAQYAQMNRSRQGLEGAGEWHQLEPLFPPAERQPRAQSGLRHCAGAAGLCASNGPVKSWAIDSSKKMIAEARRRNGGAGISYRVCALDDYEYPESRWDLVVSNLVCCIISPTSRAFTVLSPKRSSRRAACFCSTSNTRYSPPLPARTGYTVRTGDLCTGRSTTTSKPARAQRTFSAVRGRQTAPHADRNFDGSFAQRLCHRACAKRGPAPAVLAGTARHDR